MIRPGAISETQQRNRAVVDAVRELLGLNPLYVRRPHTTADWLAVKSVDYYASREAMPNRKPRP